MPEYVTKVADLAAMAAPRGGKPARALLAEDQADGMTEREHRQVRVLAGGLIVGWYGLLAGAIYLAVRVLAWAVR